MTVLNRPADFEGLEHWIHRWLDPFDPLNTLEELIALFKLSEEYINMKKPKDNKLPKFVEILSTNKSAMETLSMYPFLQFSTFNFSNMYVEGAYFMLGLLAWLNKEL